MMRTIEKMISSSARFVHFVWAAGFSRSSRARTPSRLFTYDKYWLIMMPNKYKNCACLGDWQHFIVYLCISRCAVLANAVVWAIYIEDIDVTCLESWCVESGSIIFLCFVTRLYQSNNWVVVFVGRRTPRRRERRCADKCWVGLCMDINVKGSNLNTLKYTFY